MIVTGKNTFYIWCKECDVKTEVTVEFVKLHACTYLAWALEAINQDGMAFIDDGGKMRCTKCHYVLMQGLK